MSLGRECVQALSLWQTANPGAVKNVMARGVSLGPVEEAGISYDERDKEQVLVLLGPEPEWRPQHL
jgi:hypothetical protein